MWFNEKPLQQLDLGDESSDLPEAIYIHLSGEVIANHKVYSSHEEAERAFLEAWVKAIELGFEP